MANSENIRTPVTLEARRLLGRARQKWRYWRGNSNQIYFEDRVDEYRRIWQSIAAELDADFVQLSDDIWELRTELSFVRLFQYQLELDNPVTLQLAGRKPLVHKLLSAKGIAVPASVTFSLKTLRKAEEFLEQHRLGIVIKPASGYAGKGVTTNIVHPFEIRSAAVLASLYDQNLLAEKQIAGECFRLLAFQGKVISAVRRTGLRITGDGRSTVRQLISNLRPSGMEQGPRLQREIDINLDAQEIDTESVPASMREIVVSGVSSSAASAELRTVYDTEVLPAVCRENIDCAEVAARVLRSDFLGVDIITTDIGKPLNETSGVVNEANTTPALHHHYDSNQDQYPRVAMQIVKQMLARTR
jgi:cyanophycin synthetase